MNSVIQEDRVDFYVVVPPKSTEHGEMSYARLFLERENRSGTFTLDLPTIYRLVDGSVVRHDDPELEAGTDLLIVESPLDMTKDDQRKQLVITPDNSFVVTVLWMSPVCSYNQCLRCSLGIANRGYRYKLLYPGNLVNDDNWPDEYQGKPRIYLGPMQYSEALAMGQSGDKTLRMTVTHVGIGSIDKDMEVFVDQKSKGFNFRELPMYVYALQQNTECDCVDVVLGLRP